ncbi:hypothetical protein E2C01_064948 [Portunus trituberculatus]|uniref:Uncharacterized protein n=1 Tax=Portunus trituberculatus TaxID=210409 RepID=A0A5B7HQF1_PORTR|nr:hypothetical protein [Portunus trituberculatus]
MPSRLAPPHMPPCASQNTK